MRRLPLVACAAIFLSCGICMAQKQPEPGETSAGFVSGILERDTLTGDWFGLGEGLEDHGVELSASYIAEVWGNTTGGIRTGSVYTGLMSFGIDVDLDKLVGWKGGSLSTNWLWLSGQDASEELVGNFLTISNIAGFNTFRNFELWFQQEFLDGMMSLRFGQLAADAEFVISDYGSLFINGTFGWPAFIYQNVPGGGPGYPMGAPGARLAVNPTDWFTFQTAVYQGNVFDQNVNRHGFRWRLDGENGFLFLNEAQLRWNQGDEASGLPGQGKAGMWVQTGRLADVLAESTNSGNFGWYFILDQQLYREPTTPTVRSESGKGGGSGKVTKEPVAPEGDSSQGLGAFTRIAFAKADRNFLDFYVDAGLSYTGLIPGRDNDTIGIAFAYAQLSSSAERQIAADTGGATNAEMVLEATYQCQLTPWLSLQPDLQFVIQPGADRNLGNAFVLGMRAAVTF